VVYPAKSWWSCRIADEFRFGAALGGGKIGTEQLLPDIGLPHENFTELKTGNLGSGEIARLPIRQTLPSDTVAVSHQLVALLPNARASRPADAEAADRKSDKRYSRILLLLACFALGMVVLTSIL
jgi:hypothetical protein